MLISPDLSVRVERGRSNLRIVASARPPNRPVLVEVTYSGGEEGIWFRLTEGGRTRDFSRASVVRHRPLFAILRLIGDEVELCKAPSEALLGLLFQSLLVYVSRMATLVPLPRWGRVIRDRRIERALELLEADLSKFWSVELLARAVGLSRPAFARQFLQMMRQSPMRYLAHRRMQVAADLLLASDAALAEIAARVGYQSEFAFGRAFKRHHHVAPGIYRRRATFVRNGAMAIAA
ncbi:MAG TPA: AraC family transcriptional regulator [Polyangiaceae bacterium]|nr:AraC family transcriptional regulator [Polyangiaceae bacterium]